LGWGVIHRRPLRNNTGMIGPVRQRQLFITARSGTVGCAGVVQDGSPKCRPTMSLAYPLLGKCWPTMASATTPMCWPTPPPPLAITPLWAPWIAATVERSRRPSRVSTSGCRRTCGRRVLGRSLWLRNIENMNMEVISGFWGYRAAGPGNDRHQREAAAVIHDLGVNLSTTRRRFPDAPLLRSPRMEDCACRVVRDRPFLQIPRAGISALLPGGSNACPSLPQPIFCATHRALKKFLFFA
jgi:hypothetical protein